MRCGVDGHGAGRHFVVTHRIEGLSDRRAHKIVDAPDAGNGPQEYRGEVRPVRLPAQASRPADVLEVLDQALDDEQERQGDDGKVIPSRPEGRNRHDQRPRSRQEPAQDQGDGKQERSQGRGQESRSEESGIDEHPQGEHRGAVGAQRHETGVGARELAHVSVDDVQAQGEHGGDQGEFEHESAVVVDPRPHVQDRVQEADVDDRRDHDRQPEKPCGQAVRRDDDRPRRDSHRQPVDQQHVQERVGDQEGFLQHDVQPEQRGDLRQPDEQRDGTPHETLQGHREERAGKPPDQRNQGPAGPEIAECRRRGQRFRASTGRCTVLRRSRGAGTSGSEG